MDDMQELSIHIKILYYIVTRTSIHFERRSTNTVVYAERSVAVARYPPSYILSRHQNKSGASQDM